MREENYSNYPQLGALSGVPFREVYKILRSTPFGHLRSCTPMYTPFDASRKITPDTVYVNASGLSEAKLSSGYTSNYSQYIEIDADAAIAAGGEIKVELTAPETFGSIVVGSVTFTVPAEEVTEETV